jgi:hypothetical protein
MEAIAHNKAFAKKVGIPQSVGQEFSKADKGKKFKQGGIMAKKEMHSEKSEMKMDKEQDKAMIKKAFRQHDMQEHKGGKGTKLALKKGGSAMCGGGKTVKMAAGGRVKKMADGGAASPFGNTPLGGLQRAMVAQETLQSMTPAYGGGNQGGAQGGLGNVYSGAGQIGQSLNTIQGALGGKGGGSQSSPDFGKPQGMYKKGGKVMKMAKGGKVKKMAIGGAPDLEMPSQSSLTIGRPYSNQGGAYGGLNNVYQGAGQVGQSLGTIQGALGGNGGQGLSGLGGLGGIRPQTPAFDQSTMSKTFMKKGGKVKAKKMADGGMPIDPHAVAMAQKKAAMAKGAKRGMPMTDSRAPRAMPPMGGMPQGKPMVGRMPPQANMPVPTMKKGGTAKMKSGGACMARGGGIETKGKTKGKMVKMATGGSVGSASRRGDGCAVRGKTRA